MRNDQKIQEVKKKPKGVRFIALCLFLTTLPGIYKLLEMKFEAVISPVVTLQWGYNITAILCGVGLLLFHDAARKGTIFLLSIFCISVVLLSNLFLGPSLGSIVDWISRQVALSEQIIKTTIVVGVVASILFPVMAILYLTYPKIKYGFRSS